jgi:hypothetical protein
MWRNLQQCWRKEGLGPTTTKVERPRTPPETITEQVFKDLSRTSSCWWWWWWFTTMHLCLERDANCYWQSFIEISVIEKIHSHILNAYWSWWTVLLETKRKLTQFKAKHKVTSHKLWQSKQCGIKWRRWNEGVQHISECDLIEDEMAQRNEFYLFYF